MQTEKTSFARFGERGQLGGHARSAEGAAAVGAGRAPKTAVIFDWVVSGVFVALFFGLPLFFTGFTFQGIAFEKTMFFYLCLLVGLVAWVSQGVMTGEMRIRRTPLDIPILLFWGFSLVTVIFSVDRWHSFWGFFGDPSRGFVAITAFVLVYYFLLSHWTERRFRLVLWASLGSGLFVVVWTLLALMQVHFLPKAIEQFAPLSLIGTMTTLSLYLAFLVPLFMTGIFVLHQSARDMAPLKRRIGTGILIVGLAADLFLLLALYSMVSWPVVLGGLGFLLVYVLAQIVRPAGEWTWLPMVVFVVVLVFLMIGKNDLSRTRLPEEVTPPFSASWEVAQQALREKFFAGTGTATYGYAFSLYRPQEFNDKANYALRFYQGTGLVAEALPTIGVVGTVLMLVLWFAFLSIGLYLLTLDKEKNKVASLGFWAVAVMFFIAGFISPMNGSVLIIGVLLATAALAILLAESGSGERFLQLSFKATPKFALALAFVFMVVSAGVAFLFVFMGKVFLADITAGRAVRAGEPSVQGSAAQLLKATQLFPQEGRYLTRYGQELMALANAEGRKPEGERNVNDIAFFVREGLDRSRNATTKMPNDVLAVEALGLMYENASLFATDALPKAGEAYTRAMELEPQNPLFSLKLGQIARIQGDAKSEGAERTALMQQAKDDFQQAVDKKPGLAVSHYNLAVAEARLKEIDAAIESTQKAQALDPRNLSYLYNLGSLYQLRNTGDDRDKAEKLYQDILKANERLIDVRLSLGLLYEQERKRDAALTEYQKILDFLPESADATPQVKQTRDNILKVIDNLRNGKGNIPTENSLPEPGPTTPATAIPDNTPGAPQSETLINQPAPGPKP